MSWRHHQQRLKASHRRRNAARRMRSYVRWTIAGALVVLLAGGLVWGLTPDEPSASSAAAASTGDASVPAEASSANASVSGPASVPAIAESPQPIAAALTPPTSEPSKPVPPALEPTAASAPLASASGTLASAAPSAADEPGSAQSADSVPPLDDGPGEAGGQGDRPVVVVIPPLNDLSAELDKKDLAGIIGPRSLTSDDLYTFAITDAEGHQLYVRTTLSPKIQTWAVDFLPKQKVQASALVAMDPATGQVLAMAGSQSDDPKANAALSSSFPAASLFKIVTAAAAVEKEALTGQSTVAFDGGRHTLYKKDVGKGIDKGRNHVTLKEGFAQSINSVFGKLGAFNLGPKELEAFASKFHFNQPIGFELPVQKSQFKADQPDDPYRLAELASGFNRTTTVSPLHGAMLASAIVNAGRLMEPTVVREVFDRDNRIYYRHEPIDLGRVVSERTVSELRDLMRATIREGTGRKRFHDAGRHPVLSRLDIGGKSGTINDDQGRRVDWFVGFAGTKGTDDTIALAAVVVHGPKMGIRSQELVREAIIRQFTP